MTRKGLGRPLAVAALAVVAAALLLGVPSRLGTAGRIALGVPLLLVFPGYVVAHLLFAGGVGDRFAGTNQSQSGSEQWNGLVTLGVVVGMSIVVVPVLVRGTMATVGYSRANVVLSVATFVVLLGIAGALLGSRAVTSGDRSAGATLLSAPRRARNHLASDTGFGVVTSVLLVASVAFFLSTVAFALSGTPSGETDTEFYLLTENESGDLVASDYPTTLDGTDGTVLVAGIANHEREEVDYTVVTEIQRLGNQSVVEEREILRTRRTVEADETARIRHSVEPQMTGRNLRLQYYLYRGDAPSNADGESAYRTVNLSVSASRGANPSAPEGET